MDSLYKRSKQDLLDEFAVSINSNGSMIAIGAPRNDANGIGSGHVRVYENINGVWTQIGQDIDGDEAVGNFSRSIDLSADGDIIAISSNANPNDNGRGYVKIYENINNVWIYHGNVLCPSAKPARMEEWITFKREL